MTDTGFKITDTVAGWTKADFNDVFINKNCFEAGNLWLTGYNNPDGRLGDGTSIHRSSPVQHVSVGTNWRFVDTQRASGGIKADGSLWMWGRAAYGVLGNGSTVNRSSPVQTLSGGTNWKSVSIGCTNTAAIKTDGTLWIWGDAASGNLGDNSVTAKSSPVQTIASSNNWKQVALGNQNAAAIKTDGTLWTWGSNAFGKLGNGTTANTSSPIQTVSGGTNWNSVSAATNNTAAIKTDSTLWLWGYNTYGIMGDNTRTNRSSPVQTLDGGTGWKEVSIGTRNAAAIKTDGTLWVWGDGAQGRIGDDFAIDRSSPVQTISGGTNWRQLNVSGTHIAAIKTDGTLWLWGQGCFGQLGNNVSTASIASNRSSPVQTVSVGSTWRCVTTGNSTTMALKGYTIL